MELELNSGTRVVREKEKAQVIYELRRKYKITELIKVAGIPRSTYYYHVKNFNKPDKYAEVKQVSFTSSVMKTSVTEDIVP